MTTPTLEACMVYAQVFNAARLEIGVAGIVGFLLGALCVWYGEVMR